VSDADTAPAAASPRGTPFGPGGHPTGGVRPYLLALLVLGGVVSVPLMLSDRAPDLFDRVTDAIEENVFPDLWWEVKTIVPAGDVAMHVLFFAGLALVAGLLSWSWRTFVLGQVGVLAAGMALEVMQPVFTSSRNIQLHDVASNVGGQLAGMVAALGLIALVRRRRRSVAPVAPR
jgi:hypothetical protein